jgi:hypothetical protein
MAAAMSPLQGDSKEILLGVWRQATTKAQVAQLELYLDKPKYQLTKIKSN